jgi:hypothetical protein
MNTITCENLSCNDWILNIFDIAEVVNAQSQKNLIMDRLLHDETLYIAVNYGNMLLIYSGSRVECMEEQGTSSLDDQAIALTFETSSNIELEFDVRITSLKWCKSNDIMCLLAGDEDGVVHFITIDGRLLLSHQLQGKQSFESLKS